MIGEIAVFFIFPIMLLVPMLACKAIQCFCAYERHTFYFYIVLMGMLEIILNNELATKTKRMYAEEGLFFGDVTKIILYHKTTNILSNPPVKITFQ